MICNSLSNVQILRFVWGKEGAERKGKERREEFSRIEQAAVLLAW